MRKTNKNLSRQILTLMLAFIMVFTGMGIGSWGVDTAWADTSMQVTTETLTNKVGTYNGSLGDGDIYLIKVPVDTEKLSFATQIKGKSHWASVDEDEIYSYDAVTGCRYIEPKDRSYTQATASYQSNAAAIKLNPNVTLNNSADYLLLNLFYYDGTMDFLLLEWKQAVPVSKETLSSFIIEIPDEQDQVYYHTNDKWSGKEYSQAGFWTDMQTALSEAKALFVDNDPQKDLIEGVTEKQIAVAYSKLKESKENLIPITQANTTTLYEAIKNCPSIDEATFDYGDSNLNAYKEAKNAAQTLLDSLFTGAGEATAANTSAKQSEVEAAAEALEASYSDGKLDAQISTQDQLANFLSNAASGLKGRLLHDFTLSGYEPASTFRGSLDGNGHTLTIDTTYKGLVNINSGTIRNLTICGADLNSVSAICRINYGLLEGCSNTANFSNEKSNNSTQDGAICSINEKSGIIRGCYNTGKLTGQYVGGICGQNYGLVENCLNTGMILSEGHAGGIVWRNHNNVGTASVLEQKNGIIRNCYNMNVMHHNKSWDVLTGSYMDNHLGAIVGNNGMVGSTLEGTVENCFYFDTFVKNKPYGSTISLPLSEMYQTKYIYPSGNPSLAGWRLKDKNQTTFTLNQEYYTYYDKTNEHFIAVTFDENAESSIIDAKNPSDKKEVISPSYGVYGQASTSRDRDIYLVTVPTGTTHVKFENTDKIIDYANGYNNRYVNAYRMTDNATMYEDGPSSMNFEGTAIDADNLEAVRAAAKSICAEDAQTAALIDSMLEGVDLEKKPASSGDDSKTINVKFRLVGATKSASGNYDVGTNCIDSQYVTWIATRTYAMKEGSSVGDLLKTAIKESGMGSQGENNNYVSGMYAPTILGHYYLGEFTNGTRSGWMYTVNGKHPSVGLNGYILENNDSVVWHYVNDYSYEVSDWFNDPDYPNLGDESTWDPWLKVPDVDPTKDTPTVGGGVVEEVKHVTTDTKTGTTTAPTEVKVSEKTNADGTKEKVADVKVSADNQKEILKQAKASKSKEIILVVSKNDVKDATKAELTLDKSFLESIVKDTDAKLTVKTPFGDKTYTQDELKTLIADASGATVTLTTEKSDELDETAKLKKAKELTSSLALTARSAKTAKKNVKVSLKMTKSSAAAIAELQDLGYTVNYKFYRSTKKASKYAAKLTKTSKTYLNTSGAKGSKYYYKARVMVYDQDGKLVSYSKLTQCKYASRTWSKAK